VKILHVIVGLNAGGAENVLRRLIESHRSSPEFLHSVVSLTDLGELGSALIAEGIDVQVMGMRGMTSVPSVMLKLTKLIRRRQPDLVQTWMYHADLMGGVAARLAGNRKVIWGIRSTDMIKGTAYSTYVIRRICALLSRVVPAIIVCAAEASRTTHAAIGYQQSKMVVIPNGFELPNTGALAEQRRAFRAEHGWSDDEVVVGCVGRFNHYKDHANFVKAAGLLAKQYSSTRFLMVGKGLDLNNAELRNLIASTGFPDKFTLLGFRNDVLNCLNALDVFCLSSRSEGFPNVLGEAMSIGIPCVATDVGDVRTLLSQAGIVVPKENASALCSGLAQIFALPRTIRAEMGQRGRDRIIAEFSAAKARERFEALYMSLDERAIARPTLT
jgi:glycosyltransferase involved in cell wall biosynthesis